MSWVTQLVVHPDYRIKGVARRLCHIARGPGALFAFGLVSSHPYAVRALEGAAEQQCDRGLVRKHSDDLVTHSRMPYVQGKQLCLDGKRCLMRS